MTVFTTYNTNTLLTSLKLVQLTLKLAMNQAFYGIKPLRQIKFGHAIMVSLLCAQKLMQY